MLFRSLYEDLSGNQDRDRKNEKTAETAPSERSDRSEWQEVRVEQYGSEWTADGEEMLGLRKLQAASIVRIRQRTIVVMYSVLKKQRPRKYNRSEEHTSELESL